MKLRSNLSLRLLLFLLLGVACDPSVKKVEKQFSNKEYDKVYDFVETKIKSGKAEIVSLNEEPTSFEVGLAGLVFSGSKYANPSSRLLSQYSSYIQNLPALDDFLWKEILENGYSIPEGLHGLLATQYFGETQFNTPDREAIESAIKADSSFSPFLLNRLRKAAILNIRDTENLYKLADLGNLEEPFQLLATIKRLTEANDSMEVRKLNLQESSGLTEYQAELDRLKTQMRYASSTGGSNDDYISTSYIFRGYMIALLDEVRVGNKVHELYEVLSYTGNRAILVTTETTFQSKGTFALRVSEPTSLNWKLKESAGGFNSEFPLLLEITQKDWDDYRDRQARASDKLRALFIEQDAIEAKQSQAQRSIQTELDRMAREKVENEATISKLQEDLQAWVKQNI